MPRHTENPGARERGCVKREKALALRVQGTPFTAIGKAIGVSGPMAHRYVQQALAKLAEKEQANAALARQIDLERIDKALGGVMPKAEAGDPKAVMALGRLLELRAKLLGTFAPARVEHSSDPDHPVLVQHLSDQDRADRLRELIAVTRSRQAPALLTYQPTSNGHVADGAGGVSQDD